MVSPRVQFAFLSLEGLNKGEMSRTCITRGKAKDGYGVLIVKPQGKRPFGKSGGEKLQKIKNTTF